ncbi:hypothetical protein Bsp3421_000226 (plasmid) [Burkholderia sp. FERM BP-3421]|uniref:hypothetical protein n=1 Tax=Burkholderia sp. FERM BP-3421 TaxID=1494466 RepID=UPI00235DFA40|nr:hypothetical protein [Burkholderia sp. FERM BP-3421]WDD90390.1 hypothetical protein Bsp3421_000226 [Burkholderia sp. FERM BP-3421]
MDVSIGQSRRTTMVPRSGTRLAELIVAISCLVAATPLHAERMNHGGTPGNHAHVTHQGGRHYDRHGYGSGGYYGGDDYVYGAPPLVYAPVPAPGVSLFIPLQLR